MPVIRFTSDLHFGHEGMARKRGFKCVKDMNDYIIYKHNSIVNKRDTVYILGDITMEKRDYKLLRELKGYKFIVMGNHDMLQHSKDLLNACNGVAGVVRMNRYNSLVTHVPIHPREFEYRCDYNIHGHLHEYFVKREDGSIDERYINVSLEAIEYEPKTFKELLKYYKIGNT